MNRAKLIIGLIVVSVLLVPSMFCLIPGAALTAAEEECCLKMLSTCGETQMEHSCCKPSKPSGEFALVAVVKPQPTVIATPAVLGNLLALRSEVQQTGSSFSFSKLAPEHPPSTPSIDILRI
jgi:hypothetical protein